MKTTLISSLSLFSFLLLTLTTSANSVPFTLNCPPDASAYCDDELWDLTIFGNATYTNDYGTYPAGSPVVENLLNGCNIGVIKRTWTVEDQYWNTYTCTQIITVSGMTAGMLEIDWPESPASAEGCNPDISPSVTGQPSYVQNNVCSLIGVNYEDIEFTFGPQCKKVIRKWKIIDWCTYDPDLGQGIYESTQTIKISDNLLPQILDLDTIKVSSSNCQDAYVDLIDFNPGLSACGGAYIGWHNSEYADTTGVNASGYYPVGTHTFAYVVEYGCTLKEYYYQTIVVEDASKPHPYCIASITTTLCPADTDGDGVIDDGKVSIWAKDFDIGSSAGCAGGPLAFSFSSDTDHMSQTFTCTDVGENELQMWVTDGSGNQAYCIVTLVIQNNNPAIPDCEALTPEQEHPYTVSGRVVGLNGEELPEAMVKITDVLADTVALLSIDTLITNTIVDSSIVDGLWTYTTISDTTLLNVVDTVLMAKEMLANTEDGGLYAINHIPLNRSYDMIAGSYTADINKVTAADAEILSEHIFQGNVLSDPFALLAADMNGDGEVTEEDFYLLMYVVRERRYPTSITECWHAVDQFAYQQEGIINTAIRIEDYSGDLSDKNFIAVLKGDITGALDQELSADTDLSGTEVVSSRSSDQISVESSTIYPNPFADEVVLRLNLQQQQGISIDVFNALGQLIQSDQYLLDRGDHQFAIPRSQQWLSGSYRIHVNSDGRLLHNQQIVKL